jgi:hypothetical protein
VRGGKGRLRLSANRAWVPPDGRFLRQRCAAIICAPGGLLCCRSRRLGCGSAIDGSDMLDDRPPLHAGTAAMTAMVDETIAVLGPSRQITLYRGNVPPPPFEKRDDRLDYDRCDSWQSIVLPGWSAALSYTIQAHGEPDRTAVFATVEAHWSTYGGELTGGLAQVGSITLKLERAQLLLYVNQATDELELVGATRCLPA